MKSRVVLLLGLSFNIQICTANEGHSTDRPNIIVILADDMGYSDLGCTGSEIETPNLDRLARDGLLLTHCYNVSNTPYRQGKSQEHEGGIITPMVVHWPAGIEGSGRLVHEPMHVMDVMPTCLSLAGHKYPRDFAGNQLDPLDGEDFCPLMEGEKADPKRVIYWEHEGNRAIRRGNWKLVSLHKKPWELYDLSTDPFESRNLAKQHPQQVAEFKQLYNNWATEHDVQPWPLRQKDRR